MPLGVWECVCAMQAWHTHTLTLPRAWHTLPLASTHSRDLFLHCERVKTAFLKRFEDFILENRKISLLVFLNFSFTQMFSMHFKDIDLCLKWYFFYLIKSIFFTLKKMFFIHLLLYRTFAISNLFIFWVSTNFFWAKAKVFHHKEILAQGQFYNTAITQPFFANILAPKITKLLVKCWWNWP